jgi:hypothetical protein
VLAPSWSSVTYSRIDLRALRAEPVAALAELIAWSVPELRRGATALIDSPRCPRDSDLSRGLAPRRDGGESQRRLDAALRALLSGDSAVSRAAASLSLFPTPPSAYFAGCAAAADCKPHLRAIARALLPQARGVRVRRVSGGALFTRFMLAGFATYPALEAAGAAALESYPDLVFRLWAGGARVPPKRSGLDAARVRTTVIERLARALGVRRLLAPASFDQADAAVLALAAGVACRRGSLAVIEHRAEGRFAVPLPARIKRSRA